MKKKKELDIDKLISNPLDPTSFTVEDQLNEMDSVIDPNKQVEVITLNIGGQEWHVPVEQWELAEKEGRTYPVTFKDELRLVDEETFNDFKKLMKYLNENGGDMENS